MQKTIMQGEEEDDFDNDPDSDYDSEEFKAEDYNTSLISVEEDDCYDKEDEETNSELEVVD
jgi:hypothetical protein